MKTELLSKQNDFLPVAQYGALLFVVMSEMHKLHPFYRYPLDTFIQLYHDTIAQRNRGKKSSGSPAARGAELISALSRKIFERISWSLFQGRLTQSKLILQFTSICGKWGIQRAIITEMSAWGMLEKGSLKKRFIEGAGLAQLRTFLPSACPGMDSRFDAVYMLAKNFDGSPVFSGKSVPPASNPYLPGHKHQHLISFHLRCIVLGCTCITLRLQ